MTKKIKKATKSDFKVLSFDKKKEENLNKTTQEKKIEKLNAYGRKLANQVEKYAQKTNLASEVIYFHLLYHLKQNCIFNLSYMGFKYADDSSTKEIINNHAKLLHENHPELNLQTGNQTLQ